MPRGGRRSSDADEKERRRYGSWDRVLIAVKRKKSETAKAQDRQCRDAALQRRNDRRAACQARYGDRS